MTGDMLPGESTSAALGRVTAERDEARACWSTAERDLTTARAEVDRLGLSLLKSGRANAALTADAEQAARERDLARAELSSAREEDVLRGAS